MASRLTHSHSPPVVSAPKVRSCNVWNQDEDNIVILFITLFLSDEQNKNTVLLFFALLTLKHVLHGEQKSLNHNFVRLYVALPCAVKEKCFRYYTRLQTRRCSEWRHCQQLTDANLVFSETKGIKCQNVNYLYITITTAL